MDHLTLGDIPEEMIENPDGSVDIVEEIEAVNPELPDFQENLALTIPAGKLGMLGRELCELIDKDKESRKKRDEQYEEGLRRTGLGDDAPGGAEFSGASRVVHPVLAEACVDFSSRAIKELFPASGPVKPYIVGENTPQKTERAQRKTRFMNWQLTTQISEYRSELEVLLTQLPMGGSQYQKFWHDDRLKRARSEFIPVDEVLLPYAASDFYTSPRVTHRQLITRYEFHRRMESNLYREVFTPESGSIPDQTDSALANDKIEGREDDGYNSDGLRAILEIYTWRELEEDTHSSGEYAPYIITIDEDSEQVLSIYRNWKEGDVTLSKLDWFVEWKFIPWRGAYAIGLPHLIGGMSAALTGALRALLDSAHINNTATLMKLKSGRIVGQNTQVNVTQVCDIEGPAGIDDIRKMAMAMPFNPPSPVLHQLMQDLYGLAKGVVATAEDQVGQVGDRTPVGTTMALIEQGSATYSAIHARLHESQKKALAILHRMNSVWLDEQMVVEDLGELTVTRADFTGSMDVIPVSDPTIFSEAQRFAQTQAIIQMSADPSVPWNKINIYRRALKQMRIENIDELLPPQKDPFTGNLLAENINAMRGAPLKAGDGQDHMAHIHGHMAFITSPLQLQNPLTQPQVLLGMLNHVNEHILMYQQKTLESAINMTSGQDGDIARVELEAQQQLAAELMPVLEGISAAQQALQKRIPPPQMPPEVQASIQIAQMETKRKAAYDQAVLANKQAETQAKQQMDAAQQQMDAASEAFSQRMEAAQQQFDNMMAAMTAQREADAQATSQRVELIKNEMDNHQKQITELLKNRDDNDTKLQIAGIQNQLSQIQETMTSPPPGQSQSPDMTGQLTELKGMLDQLGKQQTNDALATVIEGLRTTIEHLGRPKVATLSDGRQIKVE